jgi:hypothetical protein
MAVITLGLLLWMGPAHAQGVEGIKIPEGTDSMVAYFVSMAILVLNILTWIVFVFLQYLLDPVFIFDLRADGAQGALVEMLNQIWVLSRDLMNVFFAIALIGAAVYTMVTAKKDFISSYAAKFLLAVVLVNFSWFFPRVIFDLANVAAATVYGVPSLLQGPGSACTYTVRGPNPPKNRQCRPEGEFFVCNCTQIYDVQFLVKDDAGVRELEGKGYQCPLGRPVCYLEGPLDYNATAGYSAILNGLIMNHGRMGQLAMVPKATAGGRDVSNFSMFILREIIILVIHVAIFFPLAAMAFAFAIRIPVLWITMAFMPFIFLDFVAGGKIPTEIPKKLWKYFIKACFLPAIVGVPLTAGFIMLNVGSQVGLQNSLGQVNIRLWDNGADGAGITDAYQLLWLFMSLGVIWTGVFAALMKDNDMFAKGAGFFKGAGENLGQAALKLPLAAKVIPGINMTPLAAMKAFGPRNINAAMGSPQGISGFADSLRGKPGSAPAARPGEISKVAGDIDSKDSVRNDIQIHINNINKGGVDAEKGHKDLAKTLKDLGITGLDKKDVHTIMLEINSKLSATRRFTELDSGATRQKFIDESERVAKK